jgi:hypothetical protein
MPVKLPTVNTPGESWTETPSTDPHAESTETANSGLAAGEPSAGIVKPFETGTVNTTAAPAGTGAITGKVRTSDTPHPCVMASSSDSTENSSQAVEVLLGGGAARAIPGRARVTESPRERHMCKRSETAIPGSGFKVEG